MWDNSVVMFDRETFNRPNFHFRFKYYNFVVEATKLQFKFKIQKQIHSHHSLEYVL